MDEPDHLTSLLECIADQTYRHFRLYICVNQPDSWWYIPGKREVCQRNRETLRLLEGFNEFPVTLVDRSSPGLGWTGKKHGVGFARKTVMDAISEVAGDVIVSLDADTIFSGDYLRSLAQNFQQFPNCAALAVPYFHLPPEDPEAYRAILRYEIYMRHYFLNLARIRSPYAFTALGSAMAVPVRAFRAIGGMTPKLSGEDFYFLQKLRKFGDVLLWNPEPVHPAARFSDRVFFGTGPAMIRGAGGDWTSYPVYPLKFFDDILETYRLIPELFHKTLKTKVIAFMSDIFREEDPCEPLRRNHPDPLRFARAFHEKLDGLRVLQYLKESKIQDNTTDEENLADYLDTYHSVTIRKQLLHEGQEFTFSGATLTQLEAIRMFLFEEEQRYRFNSVPLLPGRRPRPV